MLFRIYLCVLRYCHASLFEIGLGILEDYFPWKSNDLNVPVRVAIDTIFFLYWFDFLSLVSHIIFLCYMSGHR